MSSHDSLRPQFVSEKVTDMGMPGDFGGFDGFDGGFDAGGFDY